MRNDTRLDEALKSAVPDPEAPPDLHASIMRAVRSAGLPAPPARKPSSLRWLVAPAFAALMCALWAWHVASRPTPARGAFEPAGRALTTSEEMASTVPGTALAPLTEEWQRLNQDLDNTTQFLLATLP